MKNGVILAVCLSVLLAACTRTVNYANLEDLQRQKASGRYKFVKRNGSVYAVGRYKEGVKTGKWKYFVNGEVYKVFKYEQSDSLKLYVTKK